MNIQQPDLATVPPFYKDYVLHVQTLPMLQALTESNATLLALVKNLEEEKGDYRYQPDKWSIKELLCHIMDAERIFCYRALRFARNDQTELSGFDESSYAIEANAHGRSVLQIADEMKSLRLTTIHLFKSFTPAMLQRSGKANGVVLSVLNLGYIIAGHETHHRNILEQRYLIN
jgi:DinB superfamily